MDFRERIEQSREKPANIEEITALDNGYSCEYFATDNIKSLPACLDLRFPNGNRKALPYNYFVEINFDASDSIEITTTTKKVKITGRELGKLYDYLVAYRVRYVASDIGADLEEKGLFIKEIFIEELP